MHFNYPLRRIIVNVYAFNIYKLLINCKQTLKEQFSLTHDESFKVLKF